MALLVLASLGGCSLLFDVDDSARASDSGTLDAAAGTCGVLPAGWQHHVTITIPGIADGEENVPIPIRISAEKFAELGLPTNPASLRFLQVLEAFMRHEVESWQAGGESVVWVLLPTLPPSAYFVYGSREDVAGGDKSQGLLFLPGSQVVSSGQSLGINAWHDVSLIVSAISSRMVYSIDGVPFGDPVGLSTSRQSSSEPLLIGPSFAGSIDELRISGLARGGNWQVVQHTLFDANPSSLGPLQTCPRF